MKVLAELGPAECGTCCLKVMQSGTDILICDGPYQMKFSRGQAHGLMAVLQEHFKGAFEFVDLGPVAAKDREPAEDTVALLCAAARKWAKWDARLQEIMQHDTCDGVVSDRIKMKCDKWKARTLSYGHHLLSAPVKDKTTTMCYPRLADPYMELARLDTLVQQLCARVAVLEDGGRTSQL